MDVIIICLVFELESSEAVDDEFLVWQGRGCGLVCAHSEGLMVDRGVMLGGGVVPLGKMNKEGQWRGELLLEAYRDLCGARGWVLPY